MSDMPLTRFVSCHPARSSLNLAPMRSLTALYKPRKQFRRFVSKYAFLDHTPQLFRRATADRRNARPRGTRKSLESHPYRMRFRRVRADHPACRTVEALAQLCIELVRHQRLP